MSSKWSAQLIFLFFLPCLSYGIVIDNYTSLSNDRFANDPSFVADTLDLSGVAIDNNGRWLTMLSANVFISAHHFAPVNGASVTFYSSNDPAGGSLSRTVQSSQRIGTSDLRIGILNQALTGSFASYSFATQDTTNNNTATVGPPSSQANAESFINSPYFESNAYIFGRSPSSNPISQDIAVGRNVLDRWFDSASAAGTTDDAIGSTIDSDTDTNFVAFEADLRSGDSGAPLIVESGGVATIVGINWFNGTVGDIPINGFAYLGNYDVEIQNFINTNAVPELNAYALLLSLFVGIAVFSKRKSRSWHRGVAASKFEIAKQ